MILRSAINKFLYDIYVDLVILAILIIYAMRHYQAGLRSYTGIALIIISLTLWVVSRIQLGSAFAVEPTAKQLVTKGIYSKIRHPMYVFSSLALLGIVLVWGNGDLFYLWLVVIIVQIIRAHKENNMLSKRFGKIYDDYAKNTWI